MGIETRGEPHGPRFLTQRNLEKQIWAGSGKPPPRPPIDPGKMQLFSYYKPGLTAGNYAITVEQFIESQKGAVDKQSLRVLNWKGPANIETSKRVPEPQLFEVMAPQFSLDPKLVNSFYPPEGHQDEGRILPHLVLNDPHFPWERDAGHTFSGGLRDAESKARLRDPDVNEKGETVGKDGKLTTKREEMVYRSIVPWVRLLVFDPDELRLSSADEAKALKVPDFQDLSSPKANINRQPANGAFPMTAKDYFTIGRGDRINFEAGLGATKIPVATKPEGSEVVSTPDMTKTSAGLEEIKTGRRSKEPTQVIYPTKNTFYDLCKDVEGNKYLAHVRNINTIGFPNAGVEEDGLFSIILSARTGACNINKPTTQIVHLVSIEHVDATLETDFQGWESKPAAEREGRIGLISLYSWTYTALPPDPVNFIDSMMAIVGNIPHQLDDQQNAKKEGPDLVKKNGNMQMLRPSDKVIDALLGTKGSANQLLASRLRLGYSIARWRSETGEVSAAFNRGPLTPIQVPVVPCNDWPTGSTTSKNYQIFDKSTGMMDLSYSSAWQLGKILAISDTTFSSALMRFRSQIHNVAESSARAQINGLVSKNDTLKTLIKSISEMRSLLKDNVQPPRRVGAHPTRGGMSTSLDDPNISAALKNAILKEVKLASQAGTEVYNEFNSIGENNTDWSAILKWITDKLYLADIPAHILFPDPSFIPEESIRFFYIDDAWMDCLIDGALSVGNHLERDDDQVKTAIKELYNLYLRTTVPKTIIRPQIPCYGFVLRSQIVKVMPDLKITVNWNNATAEPKDQRAPVCQWMRPDDHTLICLLDRPPEELAQYNEQHPDQSGIILSQPPHQQRFSFGHAYVPATGGFEFRFRHLYTVNPKDGEWPLWEGKAAQEAIAAAQIDPKSRVLKLDGLAKSINKGILQVPVDDPTHHKPGYIDYVPNSAELALELNDPAYYFAIYPQTEHRSDNTSQILRQLWTPEVKIGVPQDDPTSPTQPPFSDPIGDIIPVQPSGPDTGKPVIVIPSDVPGQGSKVIFNDKPTMPTDRDKGNIPGNMIPIKCFFMDVFVDYKGLYPRNDGIYHPDDYIPTNGQYLNDLVFSIRKGSDRTDVRNKQRLREILVRIPTAPVTTDVGKTDALMTPDWSGSVHMLGNQRFVPLLNRTATYLDVRLIPRSAETDPVIYLNDNRTTEVSFKLTDVAVPPTKVRKSFAIKGERNNLDFGFAEVKMWERYQIDDKGLMVASVTDSRKKYFVIKKEVDE
ncbi:hypothetical protein BCR34DRAFT_613864 [Clohesyomyces aquaticus]|uniref:Uncharacterized protein n=1 Tax=Clohesyomyces aquaticus TaxID=1231657 RepID=A0A1Y1ZQR1_9PLEO|nr:hypothetical protein BCR34DRAFT_613864 [Clohesyomyces aquaticus]